jgi:hypothetical protein
MEARKINEDRGFPRSFRVLARTDGEGLTEVLEAKGFVTRAGCWHEWDLVPVPASSLRLEFYDVGWRSEGKYFLQFMQLELYEDVTP